MYVGDFLIVYTVNAVDVVDTCQPKKASKYEMFSVLGGLF